MRVQINILCIVGTLRQTFQVVLNVVTKPIVPQILILSNITIIIIINSSTYICIIITLFAVVLVVFVLVVFFLIGTVINRGIKTWGGVSISCVVETSASAEGSSL